jgi:hypothetical protein
MAPPKLSKRISSITAERRALPASPSVAQHGPVNFRFNVYAQRAVHPTSWSGRGPWVTPNAGGHSDNRGVGAGFDTGAYPDDPGTVKVTD